MGKGFQELQMINTSDIEVGVVKNLCYHKGIQTLRKILFIRDNKLVTGVENEPQRGIDL